MWLKHFLMVTLEYVLMRILILYHLTKLNKKINYFLLFYVIP